MDSSKMITVEEFNKKVTTIAIIDMPASVMIGLGLYGKFAADGDAFHPLLNDAVIINSLLILGGVIMSFCACKLVLLTIQKNKLKNQ